MRALGNCDGPLSGEHLISKSIILLLQGEGDFTISGLPWLSENETKIVGASSLTAKCLCRRHNTALHKLDDAALFFFRSLKASLEKSGDQSRFLVSGHDIERWLLKTSIALAVSGNLAFERKALSGNFVSEINLLELLDNPIWPERTGLFCVMEDGQTTENRPRFQLRPLFNSNGEIQGVGVNILGVAFSLLLFEPDLKLNPPIGNYKYRPTAICIRHNGKVQTIDISWEGPSRRPNVLNLHHVRDVPA